MKLNDIRLGILGGGQLGKMLCHAASSWNVETYILDPSYDCPSSSVCTSFFLGDLNDYETVLKFGNQVDLLTIEIEHVNTDALLKLKELGVEVRPKPETLRIIQNKGEQKKFYSNNNLPTSPFLIVNNKEDVLQKLDSGEITIPFVQKTCKLGYDGKGVKVINTKADLNDLLESESVIENLIEIEKEISVIVCQNSRDLCKQL